MHSKIAVVAVGVIGFVIGIFAFVGVVPLGSVTCVSGCQNGITVDIVVVGHGLTINATDDSTLGYYVSLYAGWISWGDGSTAQSLNGTKLGATFSHTYPRAGSYTLTASITGRRCTGGRSGTTCSDGTTVGTETISVSNSGSQTGDSTQQASVNASFALTTVGLSAWLNDTTKVVGDPTVSTIQIAWGDGFGGSITKIGGGLTHTYSTYGTYNVTETIDWTFNGTAAVSVYSVTQNVTSGKGGCSGNCNNTGGVTNYGTFGALTGFLLVGFGSMIIVPFVPTSIPVKVATVGVAMVVGFAIGWAIGGLGLL